MFGFAPAPTSTTVIATPLPATPPTASVTKAAAGISVTAILSTAPTEAPAAAAAKPAKVTPGETSTALVVATKVDRPIWQNVDGFPATTFQLERRKLNNFADINSYASLRGYTGFRPLDCKGELGAGPVQRWKEMLREGSTSDRASSNYFKCAPASPQRREAKYHVCGYAHGRVHVHAQVHDACHIMPCACACARAAHVAPRRVETCPTCAAHDRTAHSCAAKVLSTPLCALTPALSLSRAPQSPHLYDGLHAQQLAADGNFTNTFCHLAGSKDYSLATEHQGIADGNGFQGLGPLTQGLHVERGTPADPMTMLFERYPIVAAGQGSACAHGSARKSRTPHGGKRAASAARSRAEGSFLRVSTDGGRPSASHSERRARSASPAGAMLRNVSSDGCGYRSRGGGGSGGTNPFVTSGGTRCSDREVVVGRDGQFSFWSGRGGKGSSGGGGESGDGIRPRKPPEHPRTRAAREAQDRALILARARGRSPTRWGAAGERKLSIANRPAWRNVGGFPATTVISEHRKLNNFADINSYASRVGHRGFRPLDCKGENAARPVQQWKEMLRGGPDNN